MESPSSQNHKESVDSEYRYDKGVLTTTRRTFRFVPTPLAALTAFRGLRVRYHVPQGGVNGLEQR
jgi:hypothetical protein